MHRAMFERFEDFNAGDCKEMYTQIGGVLMGTA